jgi:hypothetical protein
MWEIICFLVKLLRGFKKLVFVQLVTHITGYVHPRMPRRTLAFLSGTARRGAAGKPRFARGTGSPFWQTPTKTTARRKRAAFGSPFLWFLSFVEKCSCIFHIHHIHVAWRSKRKKLARQCENWFLNNRRVSDTTA